VALGSIGVGLVEAALGASRLLAAIRPRAVILIGTAGLYPAPSPGVTLGTAVVADAIVLLPTILPGRHAYLPAIMPTRERPTPRLTLALRKACRLPSAPVANPLAITATRKAATFAAQSSRCTVENLEAFALARAATSAKIPYAVVLGLANQVGPSAHAEWKQNAAAAAAAACEAVLGFLRDQSPSP
jgi:purine-nucleoside phosphorylase